MRARISALLRMDRMLTVGEKARCLSLVALAQVSRKVQNIHLTKVLGYTEASGNEDLSTQTKSERKRRCTRLTGQNGDMTQ